MARMSLDKLTAVNAHIANCNTMHTAEKGSTLWWLAKWENERLEKRYPSLRTTLYV